MPLGQAQHLRVFVRTKTKPEHQDRIEIGAPDERYALDDGVVIVGIVNAAIQQFLTEGR
jgi:hypothetical protein